MLNTYHVCLSTPLLITTNTNEDEICKRHAVQLDYVGIGVADEQNNVSTCIPPRDNNVQIETSHDRNGVVRRYT